MEIVLVTGGARSGKSRYAQRLAGELGGSDVTYIATAVVTDPEMERRIQSHRQSRPPAWETIEAPVNAGDAIQGAAHSVVILDCLTVLLSNVAWQAPEVEEAMLAAVAREIDGVLQAAADRDGTLLVVTNEVGMGVVPMTPLGRWFRDAQGTANQRISEVAKRVVLMVSGVAVKVKG